MKNNSFLKLVAAVLLLLPAVSCEKMLSVQAEKMLSVQAENQITDVTQLIQTPEDAQNVLNGAYDVIANTFNGRIQNVNELLSPNLTAPYLNGDLSAVYNRTTNTVNQTINNIYQDLYLTAFRCNLILEFAKQVEGISDSELTRIEGEAKFLRALSHFYVLKTWAQPWGYSQDNSHLGIVIRDQASQIPLPRSSVKDCYDFIQADLSAAYSALPETNGAYANKYAAASLLAYTYFLQNDFTNCVTYCNAVINSGQYQLEPSLDSFHAWTIIAQNTPNPELIFGTNSIFSMEFQDSRNGAFTGLYRAYSASGATLSLSSELFQSFAQTPADNRNEWISQAGSQYNLKQAVSII